MAEKDSTEDPTTKKARFIGTVIGTIILTIASANVTALWNVNSSQEETKTEMKADATLKAKAVETQVQALYDNNLKPIIDGLLKDAEQGKVEAAQIHELQLQVATMKGQLQAHENLLLLNFSRSRVNREKEKEKIDDIHFGHSHEDHAHLALVKVLKNTKRASNGPTQQRQLPSYPLFD